MYHSVGGGASDAFTLEPAEFSAQLDWLSAHQFHTITMRQYMDFRDRGAKLPDHPVAITFDDGFADAYSVARAALAAHGMVATFFLVERWVAVDAAHRYAQTILGAPRSYVTWDEVRALEAAGNEIGSHSLTHRRLSHAAAATLDEEIGRSKTLIETELGHPVSAFAFPFNAVSSAARAVVRDAGFRGAVAGDHGMGGAMNLYRVGIYRGGGTEALSRALGESWTDAVMR